MNKKIGLGICLVIIVVGIIMIMTLGLNVGLQYSESTRIQIYMGKEIDIDDFKTTVKETLGQDKVIVEIADEFKDTIVITVKEASDEQIEELITKTNEKYELENEISDLVITNVSAYRVRDIVKPYVAPVIIALCLVTAYLLIIYRKKDLIKVAMFYLLGTVIVSLLFLSVFAITRLPINIYTMPIGLAILMIYTFIATYMISNLPDRTNQKK